MSTAGPRSITALEPLMVGQRMTRAEFHDRYQATPDTKFELIGGVVHMASPLGWKHGGLHANAVLWLGVYRSQTPAVQVLDNTSAALDDRSEVQPDIALRIETSQGGQSRIEGTIITGAPELVVEVSDSSWRIDLGPKLLDYERAGVLEYVVLAVDPAEVFWHVHRDGRLVRVAPDADGLYRSAAFPGLWLDPVALLNDAVGPMLAVLQRGLASPEHAAFVATLVQ